ncbi:PglY protein [Streptomyces mayteni]
MTDSDDLYLRDVLDMPESVLSGEFKVELSGGFEETAQRIDEYVVTENIERALRRALKIVETSVASGKPNGAYLHGSFGSGKSHFMTVLHAILNYDEAARAKQDLQPIIADNKGWIQERKFLMVPYHLVGSTNLESAILGGYVAAIRRMDAKIPVPPVYRADAMLDDARRQREFFDDDAEFIRWLGNPNLPEGDASTSTPGGAEGEDGDLPDLDAAPGVWTPALLNVAFSAGPGETERDWLASALLSGPFSSYTRGAMGAKDAFLPLENGLAIISQHAKDHGFDGLILFLDELILWLQTHLKERTFVNDEVNKLVKLVESGAGDRALPIVSFISRQRDLAQLIGEHAIGEEAKNLEDQVKYLAERIDTISLTDRNLPSIIKRRVLEPRDEVGRRALEAAFAVVETSNQETRDVLLDANGATHADWDDFKALYPLSPALLNVLVALSGALQRERTGLRLIKEMLYRRRDDMKVGQLIPLGDLWDVLAEGMSEAFTDRLRHEADTAIRFYAKAREVLLAKHKGQADTDKFRADDRFIKTLLLAYLAPEVPALERLTASRLAALNHGSIRSRTGQTDRIAKARMQELVAEFSGPLRSEGESDPVFSLHLSDLDVEPILDRVTGQDQAGVRKNWLKDWLWKQLDLEDDGQFVNRGEVVWHGTRRTVEFVFADVCDPFELPDGHFAVSDPGAVRIIIGYPFADSGDRPTAAENRIYAAQRQHNGTMPTLVWLPSFLSDQRSKQFSRLLKINYLLGRDRLREYAAHLASDDQIRLRHQLEAQREVLTSQLAQVLPQAYGIAKPNESDLGYTVTSGHVHSLLSGHAPRLQGGGAFRYNLLKLADGLLDTLHPKHPNFDRAEDRKPVTPAQFKKVHRWITRAMDDSGRRVVVDSGDLELVRRVVHPLELGEVHDGPLIVGTEWRRAIDRQAAQHSDSTDRLDVEDVRRWIADLGWTGLDRLVGNLVIATYAMLADRSWVFRGKPESPPELDQIGPGWELRAQELPTEEEFEKAQSRASAVFGTTVPSAMRVRNVQDLASGVLAKAAEWRSAVIGLRQSLSKHRIALGITGAELTAREQAVRDATDLLARVQRAQDMTPLARDLAAATYLTSDFVLGTTMSTAQQVLAALDALDEADWKLFDGVRQYTDRGDGLADRAERVLREVAEAATEQESESVRLALVLKQARRRALEVIADGARLTAVAPAAPQPPTVPHPTRPESRDPGGVSLTAGQPPVDAQAAPPAPIVPAPTGEGAAGEPAAAPPRVTTRSHRVVSGPSGVLETELSTALANVRTELQEIQEYVAAHPEAAIEVTWRLVPASEQAGAKDRGNES